MELFIDFRLIVYTLFYVNLKEFCEGMKNIGKEDEQKLHLRRSQVTGDIEIECIFQRMNEFLTVYISLLFLTCRKYKIY
jgi:hypothetical protein